MIFNQMQLSEFKTNIVRHFSDSFGGYHPEFVYAKEYSVLKPVEINSREQWIYENVDPYKVELSIVYWENTVKPKYETVMTKEFKVEFEKDKTSALDLIFRLPEFSELSKILVNDIFPIDLLDHATPAKPIGRGFSTHGMPGAIFVKSPSLTKNVIESHALNIVHEFGHQALMLAQWHNPIFNSGAMAPIYSIIRKTERPAIKCLHALVAASFMIKYVHDLKANSFEVTAFNEIYNELIAAHEIGVGLMEKLDYTEIGKEIYDDCRQIVG